MNFPDIILSNKHTKRLNAGHGWVFNNEIHAKPDGLESGAVVRVKHSSEKVHGLGFFNPQSLIAVRLFTTGDSQESVESLLTANLNAAIDRRDDLLPNLDLRRIVFSDSDLLPGLIIDQFGKGISIQMHIKGLENYIDTITSVLVERLQPEAIYLRNDTHLREFEGLASTKEKIYGNGADTFDVIEHGINYHVDPLNGQKTGFYIDQRDNRQAFRSIIKPGMSVLDAFCNEGGFALNAAVEGAKILALDISEDVLVRARHNAELNKVSDKIDFQQADVMKWIGGYEGEKFDIINLDPPNFSRSRKTVPQGRNAFRKLHQFAIKNLNKGGYFMTSCCSHHLLEETILETVTEAAKREGVILNLVYRGFQPADHPVRVGMPETFYLKAFIFQKIG